MAELTKARGGDHRWAADRWLGPALALIAAFGVARPAQAQPTPERWLLSGDVAGVAPLSAPQRNRFRPGALGGVSLTRSLHPVFLVGVRAQGGILADGLAPEDPALADPGRGTLGQLMLTLRVRPLGRRNDPSRASGLFVELDGGGGFTGDRLRMSGGAALGWGFEAGLVTVAPVLRYLWVHQPPANLDSRDAHLIALGVELTFLDGRGPEQEEEPDEDAPAGPGDRDHDGVLDPDDGCPDEPEDIDLFEDGDGCPDPDNDADGILDDPDECPNRPEDPDGFRDDDGCPDDDNDLDGFSDTRDSCPEEAEVVNGVRDNDGCPDEGLIEMVNDRIVLEETVLFDFQRSRVKSRARPVINAIVELVRQHPEWTKMRVEGHADVRGNEEFNLSLSERRARNAMRALVEAGMPPERVEYQGYGESRPRDLRRTEEAHQRNRRVEFVVLRQRELTDEEIEERDRQGDIERGELEENAE